jgi:hypothetical protein
MLVCMKQRAGFWLSVMLLLSLAVAACGGSDDPVEGPPPVDDGVCANDTRGETYAAGMTFEGENGLTVTLEDASPAPPVALENTWTIEITDAAGAPVTGATLDVEPIMSHGGNPHGTPTKVVVTELGGGRYRLSPVYLNMVGFWNTTIRVTAGSVTDEVELGFCVE